MVTARRSPLGVVAFLLLGLATIPAVARTIRVGADDIVLHDRAGIEYIPLHRLVEALDGKYWQVKERYVALLPGDSLVPEKEYVFWADSALIRCAADEYHLPIGPIIEDGQLLIPILGLADVFPELSGAVPWLALVEIGGAADTAIVQFIARDGESIPWVGETRSSLEYRLVLGARCDSFAVAQLALVSILAANGLVRAVELDSGVGTVLRFTFHRPAMVLPQANAGGLALRITPRPERRIHRLVLDPGHGGKDPGAIGTVGTLEKTVVLDIVERLKRKLEEQGFEVLLTRSTDRYVPLSARSKFACEKKADLFISVHANASPNRSACGFETYFLSEAKSDWERAVAARENAALEFELADSSADVEDLELILTDLAQNEYLTESSELAAAIQETTFPHARIRNRGVRQANFYVLRCNYMPAVLVECGFLTNRSEEKLLRNPNHRERISEGIARGIAEFVKRYELRINGT